MTYAFTQALEVVKNAGAMLARQAHQGRVDAKDVPAIARKEAEKTIRKIRPSIASSSVNIREFAQAFMREYEYTLEFLRNQVSLF